MKETRIRLDRHRLEESLDAVDLLLVVPAANIAAPDAAPDTTDRKAADEDEDDEARPLR